MLEVVTDSATLRTIQTEHGVTGSFKDKPLSNWLMRYNPTDSDYQRVSTTVTTISMLLTIVFAREYTRNQ